MIMIIGLTVCNSCQSDTVVIENSDYDFGIVPDSVRVLHHRFMIENRGQDSCHIKRIDKSCGCTNVKASSYVIAPGASVALDVDVNMGSNYKFFERDISVYTDASDEPLMIFVRASRRMPARIARMEFPVSVSENIRVNMPYIVAGFVSHNQSKSTFINILNTSDKTKHISASIVDAPPYISVFSTEEIEPDDIGRIIITFDLKHIINIWGLQRHTLLIEAENERKEIPVEAIFVEDFSKEKTNARIMIPATNYTIDTSVKTEVTFRIINIGKDVLRIRNIKTDGETEKVSLTSYEIKSGEEDTLVVKAKKNQTENIEIGLTTNDPNEPYKIVRVFCKPE